MPRGTTVHQVFRPDGDRSFDVITADAYISKQAYLRDMVEGDSDVIYVKNGLYKAEIVTPSGTYNKTEYESGLTTYNFTSKASDARLSYGRNVASVDNPIFINYVCSSDGATIVSEGGAVYNGFSTQGTGGRVLIGNYGGVNIYGFKYAGPIYRKHNKSTVTVTRKVGDTEETLTDPGTGSVVFTISQASYNVNSISILKSTAPTYLGKILVPAKLVPAATTAKKYRYMTYVQSSGGTTGTATVLAKTGTAAIQTFAFDIDDSDLYD